MPHCGVSNGSFPPIADINRYPVYGHPARVRLMLKLLMVAVWGVATLAFGTLVLLSAGFAGGFGAIVAIVIGLALWAAPTTLLTDWLGLTKVWPHSR